MFLLSRSARHTPSDVSRIRHAAVFPTSFLSPFPLSSLCFQHLVGLPTCGCPAYHFQPGRFGKFRDLLGFSSFLFHGFSSILGGVGCENSQPGISFLFLSFSNLFHVDSCQYLRGGFPQIPSLFLDKVSICIRLRRRNGSGHKYN